MRNIIMVTFDSLRADHCSFMGYERETTPHLDRLANDGVYFENVTSPASRTNPSMAGTLTGEPLIKDSSKETVEFVQDHFGRNETIAERLSQKGYTTGAFCPNAYASRYYGFDKGFDMFEDFLFESSYYQDIFSEYTSGDSTIYPILRNLRNAIRREEVFKTWDKYIDQMETWVEKSSEPFFMWTFSLDTHFPYLVPRKHRNWSNIWEMYYYNLKCYNLLDKFNIELSEKEKRKIVNIYDDSIHFADILLKELNNRFSEYDPIIIVHGDHGEALDEHGMYGHFYPSLYEENIRVPLVIANAKTGQDKIKEPVSLLDLPEIIDNLSEDQEYSPPPEREWIVVTDYDEHRGRNLTGVRTSDKKYIIEESEQGKSEEMYQLPNENADLTEQDDASDVFRDIVERRVSQEKELLAMREIAGKIGSDEEYGF